LDEIKYIFASFCEMICLKLREIILEFLKNFDVLLVSLMKLENFRAIINKFLKISLYKIFTKFVMFGEILPHDKVSGRKINNNFLFFKKVGCRLLKCTWT
jgi:hypothetical protein